MCYPDIECKGVWIMDGKMTWDYIVPPSMCDTQGRLGIPNAFDLFMDMAGQHSDAIGNGVRQLTPVGRFWITTKTLIRFYKRPAIGHVAELSTWPENVKKIKGLKGNRIYEVRSKSGELLLDGKTEWTMLDRAKNEYVDLRTVYPEDFEFCEDVACDQNYFKIRDDFDCEPFASYKVLNLDTDFVGHMNNVAYVRAFANCFSAEEWRSLNIKELEIHFRRQCFEGDILDFSRRPGQDGYTEVRGSVDGATKVMLRYK